VFYNGIRQAVIPQVHRSQDQLKHAPPGQLSSRPTQFELRAFASSAATSRRRATQANQGSEGQHKNAPWPLDSWPLIQHRGPRRWVCSAETKDLMSRRERTALDVLRARLAYLQGAAGAMNGSNLSPADGLRHRACMTS
jgi:hypothetical protein